jgi:hypothetical protein
MILFSRRNLHYSDYKWSNYLQHDPRVNGKPDDTIFNKEEGNEVVYLINKLMSLWDYRLPPEISKQEEVQEWLKANLKF